MPITCQVVTKPMRNLLRARNGHVIGPLRAYYVPHVTRYVVYPCNSLYYVHVIESVRQSNPAVRQQPAVLDLYRQDLPVGENCRYGRQIYL